MARRVSKRARELRLRWVHSSLPPCSVDGIQLAHRDRGQESDTLARKTGNKNEIGTQNKRVSLELQLATQEYLQQIPVVCYVSTSV